VLDDGLELDLPFDVFHFLVQFAPSRLPVGEAAAASPRTTGTARQTDRIPRFDFIAVAPKWKSVPRIQKICALP
jgi:hypothetical protein